MADDSKETLWSYSKSMRVDLSASGKRTHEHGGNITLHLRIYLVAMGKKSLP